jgi:hypothetical protein
VERRHLEGTVRGNGQPKHDEAGQAEARFSPGKNRTIGKPADRYGNEHPPAMLFVAAMNRICGKEHTGGE